MSKEAMKLALEALEDPYGLDEYNRSISDNAIIALREALVEQPAQQEQKAQQTFAERCQLAQQLLPDAQYRAMLTKLHAEMLAELAEQRDLQAEILEQCRINGMSAEREEALRAEVERLNKAQKRKWVGLTDEEVIEISHLALTRVQPVDLCTQRLQAARMTEAKLKEKNT